MREIESADVLQLTDSSSEELLKEIRAKHRAISAARVAGWATLCILLFLAFGGAPPAALGATILVGAVAMIAGRVTDQIRKSVVLFYELDADAETRFEALLNGFEAFRSAQRVWHVSAEADVHDQKRNAGASTVVKRQPIRCALAAPSFLKTNVEVPSIPVGRQTLYLLPDRVLVYDRENVGAVSYADLHITSAPTRFIEDSGVPGDAQVVGRTWRYVNKKGGPDKRFRDNRELPICLYEEVHLSSGTGLNERLQLSRTGGTAALERALSSLSTPPQAPIQPSRHFAPVPPCTRDPASVPRRAVPISPPRSSPTSAGPRGEAASDRYFGLLTEMQDAQSARDYTLAIHAARESFAVLGAWIENEKRRYGTFNIPSVPCLQVAGTLMAVMGDRDGLQQMRQTVEGIPELEEWRSTVDAHEADADLVDAIMRAVATEPGVHQRHLKARTGAPDGRRPATLADWLEKAGRIRREREGTTYRLYAAE
jgi:hypothetical protein